MDAAILVLRKKSHTLPTICIRGLNNRPGLPGSKAYKPVRYNVTGMLTLDYAASLPYFPAEIQLGQWPFQRSFRPLKEIDDR